MELANSANAAYDDGNVRGGQCDADADEHRPVETHLERGRIGSLIDAAFRDVEVDTFVTRRNGRFVGARRGRLYERARESQRRGAEARDQRRAAGVGDGEATAFVGSTKRDAARSWIRTLRYVTPDFGCAGRFVRTTVYPPT